jgi:hypothetical protein
MKSRHQIWINRENCSPKPWTTDPILQTHKFCNIYRNLDRVTIWIHDNWLTPHQGDPDLWFAMTVARFVNWPDTLQELGYSVPWNPKKFLQVLQARTAAKQKVYSGAYMVRSDPCSKVEYLAHAVLTPLWTDRKKLRPNPTQLLKNWHSMVVPYYGMGSFMVAQIIADYKYARPFLVAPDWDTFAASGPGSKRGLNRVLGRDKNATWKEDTWYAELMKLKAFIDPRWAQFVEPALTAQDLQGCLCEADKYWRVKNGEGRPRSLYNGVA